MNGEIVALNCLKFHPSYLPGDDAHDGAIRIFGVMRVLSDSRRLGKALATRR